MDVGKGAHRATGLTSGGSRAHDAALPVAVARACGHEVAHVPGLAMRRSADLHPGQATIDARDTHAIGIGSQHAPHRVDVDVDVGDGSAFATSGPWPPTPDSPRSPNGPAAASAANGRPGRVFFLAAFPDPTDLVSRAHHDHKRAQGKHHNPASSAPPPSLRRPPRHVQRQGPVSTTRTTTA